MKLKIWTGQDCYTTVSLYFRNYGKHYVSGISRKIGLIDHKLSDLETIVLIIILSLINYIPFAYITGIQAIDEIGGKLFVPEYASILIVITVGMGFVIGWIFKRIFKKSWKVCILKLPFF